MSGCEKRKRKAIQENNELSQRGSLSEIPNECLHNNIASGKSIYDDRDQPEINAENEENAEEESSNEHNIDINDTVQLDNDLDKWPDKVRIFLVKRGPPNSLINFYFTLNENRKKLNPIELYQIMKKFLDIGLYIQNQKINYFVFIIVYFHLLFLHVSSHI